ncbi:hypothetical protein R1flu_017851 [Riccia fluitans]|uniref:BTB domain-containing protein n=1 Tax=Riccia fluitans TaxID=41844 RepID=A0ABD1ZE76_9MARC
MARISSGAEAAEGTKATTTESTDSLALLLMKLDGKIGLENGSAKELASVKQELLNLRSMYELQRKAHNEAQVKLRFLKLPEYDSISDSFKGDVSFVVHGSIPRTIHAHRFILAGRSSVFKKMFEAGMMEEKSGRIDISDASYPTMRAVVNCCYTAEISFDDFVVPEEVLKVAHKYDIPLLRTICDEELSELVNQTNLVDMLRLARTYDAHKLEREAMKYFRQNFEMVQESFMDNMFPVSMG